MNKKLLHIAYRMERQAERILKQARQLREMAAEDGELREKEIKYFEAMRELRSAASSKNYH